MERPGESLRRPTDSRLHERLGFRETTIRDLIKKGHLTGVRVRGVLRVPDSAVDEFIAKAKRGGVV